MPSQDRYETSISIQTGLLERMFATRVITSGIAYTLMTTFLPAWICVIAYMIDLASEWLTFQILRRLEMQGHSARYGLLLVVTVVTELAYCVPTLMIWQMDHPYAKALAVGLLCVASFQIANTKSVLLPLGLVALGTAFAVTVGGNAQYWISIQNPFGFAVSSAGICAAALYSLTAMLSNNHLHSELMHRGHAAQVASRAKGTFIAQVSHELRTPLNAIIGMGSAELTHATTPASAERMQVLVASARGLAVVLDDILDFSALDSKGVTIRPQAIDLGQELGITVALFRPQFDAAGLTLTLRCQAETQRLVMLDPARLRQCLSNLLSNALKFTKTGEVRVTAARQGSQVQIDVQDNGAGISTDEAAQLFVPFQRGAATQSGTGLGLAISRGLARQMGGDLVLLPSATGAYFRLTVAVTDAPAQGGPVEQTTALPSLRVLVVDDIATNRLVAATYLTQLGLTVVEADSGAAALQMIADQPLDLVLLDMNMPGMTGVECLAALRQIYPDHLPVIAMTASKDLAQPQDWADLGLDGFLAKPLTPESLLAALSPFMSVTTADA